MWKETSWTVLDKELHLIPERFTEGGWKGDRKGNGKGTQKGGKFKGGKGGNHGKGKGKGKKGQRLNEITEPPEEQWTGGSWEQWPGQSWSAETDTASWRDDDWYTADSNSQTSAAAEEFQRASVGDLRLSNLAYVKHIEFSNMTDWILHSELSHLVLVLQHAKLLFLPTTQRHVGIWSTKIHYWDVRTALQAETKCMIKLSGSCAPYETGKPMSIESRKVNCRRPLMAVTDMTDCVVDGFVLDHKGKVSVLIREQGKRLSSRRHSGGWDLTMKLEPPEREPTK